jgi:hypothetical protein
MTVADGLLAGAVAGAVSGAPSTARTLLRGGDVGEAVRAAGVLLGSPTLPAGVTAHAAVSLGWGLVLGALLPRRHTVAWGAAAGVVIAALDLGVVGRRLPRIAALAPLPQLADHVAYGAVVGAVLSARRSR